MQTIHKYLQGILAPMIVSNLEKTVTSYSLEEWERVVIAIISVECWMMYALETLRMNPSGCSQKVKVTLQKTIKDELE